MGIARRGLVPEIMIRRCVPLLALVVATGHSVPQRTPALRVCADPNNLPFSNRRQEGFENRIASMVAKDMGRPLQYAWYAQRRGFIRNTLRADLCDLVVGIPTSVELVLATRPYYRSTYVFLHRTDAPFTVRSLDDTILRRVKVGVQFIGDDGANTPPVHALNKRGIVSNIVGFSIYGDYRQPNPPARIIEAVANGTIDVAIVWGPLAGYFAPRQPVRLSIAPVTPQVDVPFLPFVFDIAMGVRRTDTLFRQQLDDVLVRRRGAVDSILAEYHVPRTDRRQP
jgi:mxaJ protein